MSSDVAVSLIAVGGTLGGVALGGLVTEMRDTRRRSRDAKRALRVAQDDIEAALEAVADVRTHLAASKTNPLADGEQDPDREWPSGLEQVAWTQSWIGYRDLVAQGLHARDFSTVARAFGSLVQFERGLAASRRRFIETDAALEDRVQERLRAAKQVLESSA
jgi:hypothetical protein